MFDKQLLNSLSFKCHLAEDWSDLCEIRIVNLSIFNRHTDRTLMIVRRKNEKIEKQNNGEKKIH